MAGLVGFEPTTLGFLSYLSAAIFGCHPKSSNGNVRTGRKVNAFNLMLKARYSFRSWTGNLEFHSKMTRLSYRPNAFIGGKNILKGYKEVFPWLYGALNPEQRPFLKAG